MTKGADRAPAEGKGKLEHHPLKGGLTMFYRRLMGLPTLRFSSPFSELEKMRRQMDSLFQQYAEGAAPGAPAGVFPAINLTEDKNSYYIRAELPGVQSADLDIQATGTTLSRTPVSVTIGGSGKPAGFRGSSACRETWTPRQ
jgi:hypothetical protein